MPNQCDLVIPCNLHRELKKIVSDSGICLVSWDKATKLQLLKYRGTLEYFPSSPPVGRGSRIRPPYPLRVVRGD